MAATPAVRILEQAKVPHVLHPYDPEHPSDQGHGEARGEDTEDDGHDHDDSEMGDDRAERDVGTASRHTTSLREPWAHSAERRC